jgi:hypothetical protein
MPCHHLNLYRLIQVQQHTTEAEPQEEHQGGQHA